MLLTNFQIAAYKFSKIRCTISFETILGAKTSLYVRNDLASRLGAQKTLLEAKLPIYAHSNFQLAANKFAEIRSTISFETILVAKTSLLLEMTLRGTKGT